MEAHFLQLKLTRNIIIPARIEKALFSRLKKWKTDSWVENKDNKIKVNVAWTLLLKFEHQFILKLDLIKVEK